MTTFWPSPSRIPTPAASSASPFPATPSWPRDSSPDCPSLCMARISPCPISTAPSPIWCHGNRRPCRKRRPGRTAPGRLARCIVPPPVEKRRAHPVGTQRRYRAQFPTSRNKRARQSIGSFTQANPLCASCSTACSRVMLAGVFHSVQSGEHRERRDHPQHDGGRWPGCAATRNCGREFRRAGARGAFVLTRVFLGHRKPGCPAR